MTYRQKWSVGFKPKVTDLNAWKTLSARIRASKIELEEMGEETEGMFETSAALADYLKKTVNVDILEEDGKTFRNLKDIIVDLGKSFETLEDQQLKQAVAEKLAGKTQMNVILSAISNYKQIEKAYQTAEESAGSAQREQEHYSKSLQYSIDSTKASLQELAYDLLDSDMLKGFVDFGNNIIQILDAIVDRGNSIIPIIGTISGAVLGKKGFGLVSTIMDDQGNASFSSPLLDLFQGKKKKEGLLNQDDLDLLKEYNDTLHRTGLTSTAYAQIQDRTNDKIDELITNAHGAEVSLDDLEVEFREGANASQKFGNAVKGLLAGLANAAIGFGISIALDALIKLITNTENAIERLGERAVQLNDEFKTSSSDIKSYQTEISDLHKTINDSSTSYDDAKAARERLLQIQSELIEKYGTEADAVKQITAAVEGSTDAFKELTNIQWRETINEFNKTSEGFWERSGDWWDGLLHFGDPFTENTEKMEKLMQNAQYSIGFNDSESAMKVAELFGGKQNGMWVNLSGNIEDVYQKLLQIQDLEKDGIITGYDDSIKKATEETKSLLDQYQDFYGEFVKQEYIFGKSTEDNLFAFQNAYAKYRDALTDDNAEQAEQYKKEMLNQYRSVVEELATDDTLTEAQEESVLRAFRNMYPELQAELNSWELIAEIQFTTDGKAGLTDEGEYVQSLIGQFDSEYQLVNKVFDANSELAETYELLNSYAISHGLEVQDLIDLYRELGYLSDFKEVDNATILRRYGEKAQGTDLQKMSDYTGLDTALNSLSDTNRDKIATMGDAQWEEVSTAIEKVRQETGKTKLEASDYERILLQVISTVNKLASEEENVAEKARDYKKELEAIGKTEDDLQKYVTTLKTLNPELAKDEDAATALAVANMKASAGFDDLSSNFETYKDKLSNYTKDTQEYSDSINALATDLTYITGSNFDIVDAETFYRSADGMKLLESALNGDNEALQRLRDNAAKGVYLDIDTKFNVEGFNQQYSEFVDWLSKVDLGTLEAQAEFNTQPFVESMRTLLQQGKITAEELTRIFQNLGIEAQITYQTVKVPIAGSSKKEQNFLSGLDKKGGNNNRNWHNTASSTDAITYNDIQFKDVPVPSISYGGKSTKPTTPTTPPPSGGGKTGGSGGGGGGGGSKKDPVADAAKDAADEVKEDVKSATDIAVEIFNNIEGMWKDKIEDLKFGIDELLNEKTLADLRGTSIDGMWDQVIGGYQNLADTYNNMASDLQNQLNISLANGSITPGSSEYNSMMNSIRDATLNGQQALISMEELIDKMEQDRTSIIEGIADRFKKVIDKLSETVNRMWTFWNKNFYVNKQITANQNAITKQERLSERYAAEANRVGLSKAWRQRVDSGDFDVTKLNDGFVMERIQEYTEWKDKIAEVREEIKGLYDDQRDLIKQKLENILEYYGDLESYLNSFSNRIDAAINLKTAKGQRTSISDLVQQYKAAVDKLDNANKKLYSYQTGLNPDEKTDANSIKSEIESHQTGLLSTDFIDGVQERYDALNEQLKEYNDYEKQIADLKDERKTASKERKAEIDAELKELKKKSKDAKFTSAEKKEYTSLGNILDASEQFSDIFIDQATASSATFQNILRRIGELNAKKAAKGKLGTNEANELQMLTDEVYAVADGVLSEDIIAFSKNFEDKWKLEHKNKLNKNQSKNLNQLRDKETALYDNFAQEMDGLKESYDSALKIQGDREAGSKDAYKKAVQDTLDSYLEEEQSLTRDFEDSPVYQNLVAQRDALSSSIEAESKKAKPNQKNIDKWQDQILAINDKIRAMADGATYDNAKQYLEDLNTIEKYQGQYEAGTLKGNAKKLYDEANARIKRANKERQDVLTELRKQRDDDLAKLEKEYEANTEDLKAAKDEFEQTTWEIAKQIAEMNSNTIQTLIDELDSMISRYKSAVELLNSTRLDTLKNYGITDLLGLNNDSSLSELISGELTKALEANDDKTNKLVKKGNILQSLIDAGVNGGFEGILSEAMKDTDEETREWGKKIAEQLNSNNYSDSEWIAEWESMLTEVISQLVSAVNETNELKESMRENVIFKAVKTAIDQTSQLIENLNSISGIIKDDWVRTEADGITEYGYAKINLLKEEITAAQNQVNQYADLISKIDAERANYATDEDYFAARAEAVNGYYSSLQNVESIADQIYQIGRAAAEEQVNQIKKVTEAYRKALASRKAYYEYDKQIKAANKEREALKAQIDALNGVTDAASKARRKMLEAQYQEADDKYNDLVMEHTFDLQDQALSDMITKLEESIDTSAKSIEETFEYYAQVIQDAVTSASGTDTNRTLGKVTDFIMGIGGGTGLTSAIGTIVSNGATYTPIPTDAYINGISSSINSSELLSKLADTNNYLSGINELIKNNIAPNVESIKAVTPTANINVSYDSLLTVNGCVDARVLRDTQEVVKQAVSQTMNKLYQDFRFRGFNVTMH